MKLNLISGRRAKWFVFFSALAVFVVFTAAYQKRKPKGYHSASEMYGYRNLLGDLPTGSSDMFMGSGRCAGCHGVDQDLSNPPIALINSEGVNVSPAENWRATMMANSAKDPMWRAKLTHETLVNPGHAGELTNKCTSCHAPLGRFEAAHDGIEFFTTEMLDADSLARDGVSCMACHAQQIQTTGFFFSGELHYNPDTIWGPIFDIPKNGLPIQDFIMANFVGVTPVPHAKVSKSEMCAGCHSLVTNTADLQGNSTGTTFIEQATYHEWLNSSYNTQNFNAQECQTCHMPKAQEPIIIASGYDWLPGREPFGQHWLVGGNSFMLELMKNRIDELGLTANEQHFQTVIDRTLDNLQNHTAELTILPGVIDSDTARFTVRVANKAGHKLPSGYPARRAFIEFVMTDEDGNEVFHSGRINPDFEVQGQDPQWEPHYDIISDDANEVQIYEMVMGDVMGNVTTVLERAHNMIKDNRLVPTGFSTSHAAYDTTMIVGAAASDPNFNVLQGLEGSGTDEVHYHIPLEGVTGNVTVTARFWYQSLPPKWNAEMFAMDHPLINSFEEMYWQEGPDPVQMASHSLNATIIGVNELAKLFTVSPNPTSNGWVQVNAAKDIIQSIHVYTLDGKLVDTLSPAASRAQVKLPLMVGTYLLDVQTSRGRKVERVVRR
jgi:Cytochrome c554 and c-prime